MVRRCMWDKKRQRRDCGEASGGRERKKDTNDRGEKKKGEGLDGRKIERS